MNAAIITKIEYRLIGIPEFLSLDHILYSAKLKQDSQQTGSGTIYTTVVDLSVSRINPDTDSIIRTIDHRKAQFRATDANGTIYLIGTDEHPARLIHQKALDGTAGSFGGYKCTITRKSPFDDIVQ